MNDCYSRSENHTGDEMNPPTSSRLTVAKQDRLLASDFYV